MKQLSCLLVALLFANGTVLAATAKGNSSADGEQVVSAGAASVGPADEFAKLDANHDGVLSKGEMSRHPKAAHMAMVDENHDGVLSRDEFVELDGM